MPTFDELQAFSRFLNKNKVKNIQVIGNPNQPDTLFKRFYEGLVESNLNSDEEAKEALYGKSENKEAAYYKLKARLHSRLQNTLFFIDVNEPSRSPVHKAWLNCCKELLAVKILLSNHERRLAILQAERTLKVALKFEFTDIALDLGRLLLKHFGVLEGNKKKIFYYEKLVENLEEIFFAELYAEKCFAKILINYAKSNSSKFELSTFVQKCERKLRKYLEHYQSSKLILHAFAIFSLKYEVINDYEGMLKVCKEALDLIARKKQYSSNSLIFNYNLRAAASYIMLRKFDHAKKSLDTCIKIVPKSSNNWYLALYHYIILCFHTNKFLKAKSLFFEGNDIKTIQYLPPKYAEIWIILGAFLKYLESIGKLPTPGDGPVKPFRLSKFLNEVPVFSQDKRGTNITILILQILFLLQRKKYGAIIDRTEALEMYSSRYLRRDDTYRSNCFIKMLLQLPRCQFNRRAVERHAQKYWKKLRAVPIEKARQSAEIEIMPYETLWEYVLESLSNGFRGPKK